jgi:hypothetical protein
MNQNQLIILSRTFSGNGVFALPGGMDLFPSLALVVLDLNALSLPINAAVLWH